MSEEGPTWRELRRRLPDLPRKISTHASVRILAANDNGSAQRQIKVAFKTPRESSNRVAAEVFLCLLDDTKVHHNDN